MKRLFLLFALTSTAFSQDLSREQLLSAFESAGTEFGVPADVLKGIAFAETRWDHLQWAEGDTASCTGYPRAYGIMGLRDDDFFGRSLRIGAGLIGEPTETVRRDLVQNIRAAAAYLQRLYASAPLPNGTIATSLESWQSAIASYSGIPQQELAAQHAYEVLDRVGKGYDDFGIRFPARPVNMQRVAANAADAYAAAAKDPGLRKSNAQPDYPTAHWASAYPGHWYTTGIARDFVVIHDMEGYYLGVISYFQRESTNASIHYDVNGLQDSPSDAPAGDITQQVEEQYWAWHAVCLNRYSFGIEHEGFVSNPAWWTPEMYLASADLVRHLCDRYGIPKDRNHIIGHGEYQNPAWVEWAIASGYPATFGTCNSHTDPGSNWDWGFLMQLIKRDSTAPRVISQSPSGRVQIYEHISLMFDQRMERNSVEQNFRIAPAIPGTLQWGDMYRTLEFVPTSPLSFDTEYTVTVDTGAHNYLGTRIDADGDGIGGEPYILTVRTVANDTIPPLLLGSYPSENQGGIPRTVQFELDLSEPIDPNTLVGGVLLQDNSGSPVAVTTPASQFTGAGIRLTFRPLAPLAPTAPYTLTVPIAMKDFGGNTLTAPRTIPFSTLPAQSFPGTVINSLDAVGGWWQPGTSGSTVGTSFSSFAIDTGIKVSGTGSGRVAYLFSGPSDGRVREYNSGKPVVDPGPSVAAWVFGDNSGNALSYWFYPGSPVTMVRVDTLDWTGWKLVAAPIASVPTTAARQFAGFVIDQLPGARMGGTVYFDDLAVGSNILDIENQPAGMPVATRILPNYPNPFNPSTTLSVQLSSAGHLTLRVFDALGRAVATLADDDRRAGTYRFVWDAAHRPSGVYFCRLSVDPADRSGGPARQTIKLLLVK